MNGNKLVADTSFLINYFNGHPDTFQPLNSNEVWVSIISEMELLSFSRLDVAQEKIIKSFLKTCLIVPLTEPIKEQAIALRRVNKLKLPDAIICATSIVFNVPLFSMDTDFSKIEELNLKLF